MQNQALISFNVVVDNRKNADGRSTIYFRIVQNRVKKDLATRIKWPQELFDKKNQQLLPRFADDPDVVPYNLRLNEYKSKAHRLLMGGYLKDNAFTIDDLVKEFATTGNSSDFFKFMAVKAKEIHKDGIIIYETYNRHLSSLNTLKKFHKSAELLVHRIDLEWIERFDAWAKKVLKRGHNTVCGYHKDLKKYLGIAVRQGLIMENPYKDFSFSYIDGDRQALTQDEVRRLFELYKDPEVPAHERDICRRFLFSCLTGLRISDTSLIHRNNIEGKVLVFVPYKGRGKGKIQRIPLPQNALDLVEGNEGKLFYDHSHSYVNETLKIIAARAKIYKRLTFHCSRDTFGTIQIEKGTDISLVSRLMGHSNLKTTMIYLKMSDKHKEDAMDKMDDLF